jgi:hypothetical protein
MPFPRQNIASFRIFFATIHYVMYALQLRDGVIYFREDEPYFFVQGYPLRTYDFTTGNKNICSGDCVLHSVPVAFRISSTARYSKSQCSVSKAGKAPVLRLGSLLGWVL